MNTADMASKHKLTNFLLSLLLILSCVPALTLSQTEQAWGAESPTAAYAALYRMEDSFDYTLVIQPTALPDTDPTYGKAVAKSSLGRSQLVFSLIDELRWQCEDCYIDEGWVTRAVVRGNIQVPLYRFFADCYYLESIDLRGLNTSNVTTMEGMFENCWSLTSLDLSGFDTSNVTSMKDMFSMCFNLTSLDLSGLDTSSVESMQDTFSWCSGLTSLDLSGLDTSSVTDMSGMFSGCRSLTSVDLSGLDTSNVRDMFGMFYWCSGLTSVDLSGLDTSSVTSISSMFEGCTGLTSLDLSGLDTSSVTYMRDMFEGCSGLTSVDLSSFDTSNVTNMTGMFQGCSSLTSVSLAKGSSYDECALCPNVNFEPPFPYENLLHEQVTCVSDNPSVVSVTPGEYSYCTSITPLEEGTARLKFGGPGVPLVSYLNVTVKKPLTSTQPAPSPTSNATNSNARASLSHAYVTVKERAFSGKKLTPLTIKVKLGGKTLTKGKDYTVACKGGKAVGSYEVIITGKGSYTGTKTAMFKIVPKAVSGAKAKGAKRALKVTWKKPSKAARAQVTGYQIRYSKNKSMKGAKTAKIKSASKTSATIKKLNGGKKYYVQVRAYKTVKGKTYYSVWSAAKSAKTKR